MREMCPNCGDKLVSPMGPSGSPLLLLGEFPGWLEQQRGIVWVGPAGDVLKKELALAGIQYTSCRATNVWLHEPSKECDHGWHVDRMLKEMEGRAAVLLMGSDVSTLFLGGPISDYAGMRVKSSLLPKSVKVAVACFNPAICTKQEGVGEVRLAIERFAELSREYRR
jgi:uracil-DNA glycosylase family 4